MLDTVWKLEVIKGVRCVTTRSLGVKVWPGTGVGGVQSGQVAHLMNWLYRPAVL